MLSLSCCEIRSMSHMQHSKVVSWKCLLLQPVSSSPKAATRLAKRMPQSSEDLGESPIYLQEKDSYTCSEGHVLFISCCPFFISVL